MPFTSGNFHLTQYEMRENGTYFKDLCNTLYPEWTLEAICGMLGNAQRESGCNPGIWQRLSPAPSNGYGFFQWTPGSAYINWCNGNGYPAQHLNSVILRLDYEIENGLQYYQTKKYPISFNAFLTSKESPSYLAQAWAYNYERPNVLPDWIRSQYATQWYEYFTGTVPPIDPEEPIEPPPIPQPTPTNNRFWWIYYMKRR